MSPQRERASRSAAESENSKCDVIITRAGSHISLCTYLFRYLCGEYLVCVFVSAPLLLLVPSEARRYQIPQNS